MSRTRRKNPARSYKAGVSNNLGHAFEDYIKDGCAYYAQQGRAKVNKIPEPFWVMEKHERGLFTGRFTAKAQVDFKGTLDGGRAIVFEAKYTSTERMKRDVLTEAQMDDLEINHRRGALAAVCVGIGERFFFVPWPVWRDMKRVFGRQSVTAEDLEPFRVKFNGAVLFLDYIHGAKGPWVEGKECDVNRWRKRKG